jgi:hypothetical protein
MPITRSTDASPLWVTDFDTGSLYVHKIETGRDLRYAAAQ